MSDKYYIITYGCQMNAHESEKLAGILEERNYSPAEKEQDADIIVFNTCCIRENAENRVLGNLGFVKKLKEEKHSLKVVVCGCMTQQDGAAERLKNRCPFINLIFGTHNIHKFSEYLDFVQSGKKIVDIWDAESKTVEGLPIRRKKSINAWINIMYGCNNFCSYCIVPYVRGRERSRSPEAILDDVRRVLDEGYKEITLLGQNVNSYEAEDLRGRKVDFARLLELVSDFPQKYRVRFMTSHPKDLSDNVIRVIAERPNLPEFIHLPAQSGSDRILGLMNRKYTALSYLSRVETIRKFMPSAGLSGDIMVGFPSESEQDFTDTLNLVESVRYNNLYTFIYSRRKGTQAAVMNGQVERMVVNERFKRLLSLQSNIELELAHAALGAEFEILCDTYNKKTGVSSGKTSSGKIIWLKTETDLTGEFIPVTVTDVKKSNLFGKIQKGTED